MAITHNYPFDPTNGHTQEELLAIRAPETPAGGDVSYFLRTGKHDLLTADWLHYLDVADKTFKRK